MTSAIVNSSPLIHMGDVGRLDLLSGLYASVFVPDTVVNEIRAKGPQDPAARAVAGAPWLEVVNGGNTPAALLAWDLGLGETCVLAHAMARPGTEAVIDDLAARRCAKAFGIPVDERKLLRVLEIRHDELRPDSASTSSASVLKKAATSTHTQHARARAA